LGEEEVDGAANVTVTGIAGSGEIGNVSVSANAVVVLVTGVSGTGALGEEEISGGANVYPIGVSGIGRIARPLVWGLIDTSQTPNWTSIAA